MSEDTHALILDLVEWVAARPRPYDEVMEAWRTSCPRLTIWEDALDAGYVRPRHHDGGKTLVAVTARGLDLLRSEGRRSAVSSRSAAA